MNVQVYAHVRLHVCATTILTELYKERSGGGGNLSQYNVLHHQPHFHKPGTLSVHKPATKGLR